MVNAAKRKEKQENAFKLRKHEQACKKEDFMAQSLKVWNQEIVANWEHEKTARRTHQLWWHGLPPPIRGKVWQLAIGNAVGLNSAASFALYAARAKDKKKTTNKKSEIEIELDVSRTFPQLCFFQ